MKINKVGIGINEYNQQTLGWQDACYNTVYDIFDCISQVDKTVYWEFKAG